MWAIQVLWRRPAGLVLVTLVALMVAVAGPAGTASGLTVTWFAGGSSSHVSTFGPGGGVDGSATVSVAKDSVVREATVRVEGQVDSFGRFPYDVEVFAYTTSNSTKVYGFSGLGYGPMGRQVQFATGRLEETHRFTTAGTITSTVLLPQGATVLGASMTVLGGGLNQGYTGPDYLNHQVGSNFIQLDTGLRAAPYMADIDNDGDLDLFACGSNFTTGVGYQGGPRFFRNVGNATSYQFVEQPAVVAGVTQGSGLSPALADLDGDGDLDLLVVGGFVQGLSYNVTYYRNTGNQTVPAWTRDNSTFAGITSDGMAHAAFGDVDGDGLTDVVLGSYAGGLTLFRNSGTKTAPTWTASNLLAAINVGQYSAPALGDLDGDGDVDLVVGNGTITGPNGYGPAALRVYEHTVNDAGNVVYVPRAWMNGLHIGGNYTASIVAPSLGDLDGDGDLDIQVGDIMGQFWLYTSRFSLPRDVTLDIGADGSADWTHSGVLYGAATASGLATAFSAALNATAPSAADAWGNRMAPVPVSVTTAAPGGIALRDLSILYAYAPPSLDFAGTLNRIRQGSPADGAGNVSMSLPVGAQSAGVVELKLLSIVVDLPPTALVPSNVSLLEDTRVDNLLDLATVFKDDFTPSMALTFEVVSNTMAGTVDAYITSGRWLGVDALTGAANDNWNGQLNIAVRAVDGSNLSTTVTLTVTVVPVNDAPVLAGVLSAYTINEDVPWELIPNGTDVDGDTLHWTINGLPSGASFDPASGALRWTPLQKDVGVHSLTIVVSDGVLDAQAPVVVTVLNVNDPPFILLIPNQTVTEGQLLALDLSPYYGDEDDAAGLLTLRVEAAHGRLSGTVVTFMFPKGSGVGVEKVRVTVVDPHGATAETSFAVLVLPAGPDLALLGVPDIQVVEGDAKTIDIAPYLYNVKSWANLTITAASAQAAVSGTRITFLYPVGFPQDTQRVRITAQEGNSTANWTIVVTVVRLGSTLLIADLPDLDVVEGIETSLELGPYLHNVDPTAPLTLSSSSAYARFEGTRLVLLYPTGAGVTSQDVTVSVVQGAEESSDTMAVRVHEVQAQFYLDPLPSVNAVEGQPLVVFVGPHVHNAGDPGGVSLTVASAFARVNGLTVTFLYPVGSGVTGEQVTIVARSGSQTFSTVLGVSVTALGPTFTLAGVPDLVVFAGAPYALSLVPYLYNLQGQDASSVRVTADSPFAHVEAGPQLVLSYPSGTTITGEDVTLTATLGADVSSVTIHVTVRHPGAGLAVAPIPTQYVREDSPFRLDLFRYILNALPGPLEVLAESAFVSVSEVTWLTLTFPGGTGATSFTVTVQAGGQTAQGSVNVIVEEVNDPPVFVGGQLDVRGPAGATFVWDLGALFTDEENPAGLTYTSSDPRVVIDPVARTASLVYPDSGTVRFTLTATDGDDPSLFTASPEIAATTTGAPAGSSRVETGASADLPLLAAFLLLGAVAGVLQRRDGGRSLGARGAGPTLTRRAR